MVLKIFVFSTIIVTFSSCNSTGTTNKKGKVEVISAPTAKDLFNEHCSVCHGSDGKLGAAGAKDLTKSMLSSNEVKSRIENGKNGMPPMKELLGSKRNIDSITEFVLRMR